LGAGSQVALEAADIVLVQVRTLTHTHTHAHIHMHTHTHTSKSILNVCTSTLYKHARSMHVHIAPARSCPHPRARTHTHTLSLSLTHTHKQNKLEHVLTAIDLSTAIVRRIWLNYLFAMGYNLTAVPLAAGDYYTVYSYVHVHDIVTYPPPPCIASQSQGV
jgi:cation transport ATPase